MHTGLKDPYLHSLTTIRTFLRTLFKDSRSWNGSTSFLLKFKILPWKWVNIWQKQSSSKSQMASFRGLQQSPRSYLYAGTFKTPSHFPSPMLPSLWQYFPEQKKSLNPFTAKWNEKCSSIWHFRNTIVCYQIWPISSATVTGV